MLNQVAKANVEAALEFMATKTGLTVAEVCHALAVEKSANAIAMFQDLLVTGLNATADILEAA